MAGPRIIAGSARGRILATPPGGVTRPSAGRVRQALFDILAHAPWAEDDLIAGRAVLDVFAGSGALGLEALSRGAARATFIESDRAACEAIRQNAAACRVADRARILPADALAPPPGTKHDLVLLDPPYGQDLVPRAVASLDASGWIAPGAAIAAELGRADRLPRYIAPFVERRHAAARLVIWRAESAHDMGDRSA